MSTSRRRTSRRSRIATRRTADSRRDLQRRFLYAERLENRALLAADSNPWHNMLFASDVNRDDHLAPDDVLPIINALNSVGSGPIGAVMQKLGYTAEAEAGSPSPFLDVDNDGYLSPSDALIPINILNAEGEGSDMYIRLDVSSLTGTALTGSPRPQVKVGDQFLVRAFVKDTRTMVTPTGVFAAYMDVLYDSTRMSLDRRENQVIRINGDPSGGTFTLTFNGQTTSSLTYIPSFNNGDVTGPTPAEVQTALTNLSNIEPGDVEVSRTDNAGTEWIVKFGGRLANQNVANMTATSNLLGGTSPSVSITELSNSFINSITFSSQYPNGHDPSDAIPQFAGAIDEVGAFAGTSTLGSAERLVFSFHMTATAGGTDVRISPDAADDLPKHSLLMYGSSGTGSKLTPDNPDFRFVALDIIQLVMANDDLNLQVNENTANNVLTVLANDTVVSGSKRIVSIGTVNNGSASIFDNNTPSDTTDDVIRFTPTAGFTGVASFVYTAGDGLGNTDTASVTINVGPVNDPPTITNLPGAQTIAEDGLLVFSQANSNVPTFSDPDSSASDVVITLSVTNGTLTLNPATGVDVSNNGSNNVSVTATISEIATALNSIALEYRPTQDFNGSDNLVLNINDQGNTGVGGAKSDRKTVAITVTSVNDAPINTVPSSQNVVEGDTLTLSGASAISIADADAGSGVVTTRVSVVHGTWAVPNASNATVTGQGTGTINLSGTVTQVNAALAGIVYTAPALTFGTETVTVLTNDQGNSGGSAQPDTDTFLIDVEPSIRPRARLDSFSVDEDSTASTAENTLSVLSNDVPNLSALITLESFTQPANGTVSLFDNGTAAKTDDKLIYVPNANYFGADSFTYTVNDTAGTGANSTTTVSITVRELNDAPTATADLRSTSEDTSLVMTNADLVSNDNKGTNENGQTLTITSVVATSTGGNVALSNGNVTYTPTQDFVGTFTFNYVVTDNGTSRGIADPKTATGTVTITVSEVNDAPVTTADNRSTAEDTQLVFAASSLTTNDSKGGGTDESTQTLTVTAVSAVSGGTASLASGNITFTPAAEFVGTAVVNYTVIDNGTTNGNSAPQTATGVINITVTEVNDAPSATNDSVTAIKNFASTYTTASLTSNDSKGPSNESSQTLTITSLSTTSISVSATSTRGGTVVLNNDGTITYTPPANTTGADSFIYVVSDNGTTNGSSDVKTATGTVNIDILDFVPSNVSGAVYLDGDNDGVRDSNERGVAGVLITLSGIDLQSATVNRTALTDRNGAYSFTNLAPGTYTIVETQPANLVDGSERAGNGVTIAANDVFAMVIPILGGVSSTGNDFPERGLMSAFSAFTAALFASDLNASNPLSSSNGLLFSFGDTDASQLAWWTALNGWTGFTPVGLSLTADRQSAVLTVINPSGQTVRTTVTTASARLKLRQDSAGHTVVQVIGLPSDFMFVASTSGGEGETNDADSPSPEMVAANRSSYAEYTSAADAVFAAGDWA